MAKQTKLVEFNIQNAKYAILNADGTYGSPVDMAYATKFTKESNASSKDLYGDGEVQKTFVADTKLTATLGLTAIDDAYEVAMGRKMAISGGYAEIAQKVVVNHALYLETNIGEKDAEDVIAKCWYFNVTSTKPSESVNQNETEPTFNEVEYSLSILGTDLLTADGSSTYKDSNGKTVKVYRLISLPTDDNYDTFGDSVPTPKALA